MNMKKYKENKIGIIASPATIIKKKRRKKELSDRLKGDSRYKTSSRWGLNNILYS